MQLSSFARLLGLRLKSSSPEEGEDEGDEEEDPSSLRFLLSSSLFGLRILCITYGGRSLTGPPESVRVDVLQELLRRRTEIKLHWLRLLLVLWRQQAHEEGRRALQPAGLGVVGVRGLVAEQLAGRVPFDLGH